MTKDEILNMSAGREMDRLIAAHVFGIEDDGTWLWFVAPLYSTDISAAFEVVEHLREKLGTCKFYTIIDPKKGNNVRSVFDEILEDYCFEASADSVPLAICRAALLAVMI